MATSREKFGWRWTENEREDRKQPLRQVQNLLKKILEQVRRIGLHVPQFKEQADQALRHLLAGLCPVADLTLSNRGRKYQPLSPEDFDRILARLPELTKPWQDLQMMPAFAAAVKGKNKELRKEAARIREHNKIVEAQYAAMGDKIAPILRKVDEGDIVGALDDAAKEGLL